MQLFLSFEALLLDTEQTVQIILGINWRFCRSVEAAPFIEGRFSVPFRINLTDCYVQNYFSDTGC